MIWATDLLWCKSLFRLDLFSSWPRKGIRRNTRQVLGCYNIVLSIICITVKITTDIWKYVAQHQHLHSTLGNTIRE